MIDTHAHLDHIPDLDSKLSAALEAGVEGVIAVSEDVETSEKNFRIYESYRDSAIRVYLAMGIHPSEAREELLAPCLELIRSHHQDIVAVGEIGLDFWYKWVKKDKSLKDIQRNIYRRLCLLAKEINVPVSIHSRGAWRECFDILKEEAVTKAVFHWYSGPIDVLKDILDQGFFVSTTPAITYSPPLKEAMRYAPIDQTMLETDSPVFYRDKEGDDPGFRAEPKNVRETLRAYAELKGLSQEAVGEKTTRNAKRFFNLESF
ncbi:MAG: TatD family hydrolase [Candidatus Omnitrophica bacterium]|nr:TatD family hydrolase [Candidatus Omnitrophota bacterium]